MNQPLPKLRLRRPARPQDLDGQPPKLAPSRTAALGLRSPAGLLRRIAQPLPLIGIALIVIAAVGYLAVAASSRTKRSEVVVVARSFPAGTRLTARDLRTVRLSAGANLLTELVPASGEPSLLGRRLAVPVLAGMPLARANVAAAGGGPAAFTLAVPALHAVGGNLAVGDRVSVLATFTSAAGSATTRVIARDLVVLSVGQAPAGIDQSSATVPITVALPKPTLASQLALANSVGKIDLLRDGADTTAAIPSASASSPGSTP
jgi:Flp pilus assembly protein CpaB